MDVFANNMYSIYNLVIKGDETLSIIKVNVTSKQYLAYYIYRIITKYIAVVELGASYSDITEFMKYLKIPSNHNPKLPYPIVGKMSNDNEMLDMIILRGIDILKKTDAYINSMPNKTTFEDLTTFFNQKDMQTILKDIMDLQKLIPGLSVPAIRPQYLNDNKI